jgi:thaumarchaeosortase
MHLNSDSITKHWKLILPLASFCAAIALLMLLDYFNIENIALFNQRGFFFSYTWKGRMFLLVFLMLFAFEAISNRHTLAQINRASSKNRMRIILLVTFAIVPFAYIVVINFFNAGQFVLSVGEAVRGNYWTASSIYWNLIADGDWPLALEYVVFTVSSLVTVLVAYGKDGLKLFSISLAFVAGITIFYFIDTWFPYGAFWPLQVLTHPTADAAAGVLRIMGYRFNYIVMPGLDSAPIFTSGTGLPLSVSIQWPCAGIQSLLLYSLIMLLFFKGTGITTLRKVGYFLVGAVGTFGANVFRVVTYFSVMVNQGLTAANQFHDTFGELFSAGWLVLFVFVVLLIERFGLVERTLARVRSFRDNWSKVKINAD